MDQTEHRSCPAILMWLELVGGQNADRCVQNEIVQCIVLAWLILVDEMSRYLSQVTKHKRLCQSWLATKFMQRLYLLTCLPGQLERSMHWCSSTSAAVRQQARAIYTHGY